MVKYTAKLENTKDMEVQGTRTLRGAGGHFYTVYPTTNLTT
jgi:hypothetical protein